MARIVVNPRSSTAWEVQLKPGDNFLGRGPAADIKIDDPSVSSSHCQIVVSEGAVVIKDLGSTNGTYVNRALVSEAVLEPGQTIHLGGVEVAYHSDTAPPPLPAPPEAPPLPPAPPQPVPMRVVLPPKPVAAAAAPARPQAAETAAAVPGAQNCKFHAKIPGRYFCPRCKRYFCDLCVTSRVVENEPVKFCRQCGVACEPIEVQVQLPEAPKGFFSRLPGSVIYPFRGNGVLVLILVTVIFALMDILSLGFLGLLVRIIAVGYVFSYMQTIIHSTAMDEDHLPELPGFDEIFGAFLRLVATVIVSFGPAIAVAIMTGSSEDSPAAVALIPAIAFGCFYFPMAFLAVAMKDSIMAANPLVVASAIVKVPLQYLVAAILVVGVLAVRKLGDVVAATMSVGILSTRSISELLLIFGLRAVWAFMSVYLLTVSMRILGLLYLTQKHKLGWYH